MQERVTHVSTMSNAYSVLLFRHLLLGYRWQTGGPESGEREGSPAVHGDPAGSDRRQPQPGQVGNLL